MLLAASKFLCALDVCSLRTCEWVFKHTHGTLPILSCAGPSHRMSLSPPGRKLHNEGWIFNFRIRTSLQECSSDASLFFHGCLHWSGVLLWVPQSTSRRWTMPT
mmetsp:Transcript_64247/g.209538  ORF Transcript_64247/g.209538 Transcript_64247/m.209538 type:complete len:104 (+) Transcript_64247:839-1150(+)